MFTARYGLIPYIKHITFGLYKVKRITLAEVFWPQGDAVLYDWRKLCSISCSVANLSGLIKSRKMKCEGEEK